jgi:hypothetical protein
MDDIFEMDDYFFPWLVIRDYNHFWLGGNLFILGLFESCQVLVFLAFIIESFRCTIYCL